MSDYIVTLEEAAEFRHYHSTRGGEPCNCCVKLSAGHAVERAVFGCFTYPTAQKVDGYTAVLERLLDRGWEHIPWEDSLLLRCNECRKPAYPWIASLDVERIQPWMQVQHDKHGAHAWLIDFDDLKAKCL